MKSNAESDVIIIGAGPAGMSAAIYLLRAGIKPIIFESEAPGGNLNKTHKIENYPGYTDKDGITLAFRMYSQIEELGIDFKTSKVINIKESKNSLEVITEESSYYTKYLIIASGRIPRKLDVPGAELYEGKGISYCAICDGALYKGKSIIIVGGGNTAMESASYMGNIASKIYVINRSEELRATKKEKDNVGKEQNIKIIYNAKIKNINTENDRIIGVTLNSGENIDASGIFVCIGNDSNSAYYQNLKLDFDSFGLFVDETMKTSNDKVYACGDSLSKPLYQVVTATSEGAVAATSIINKLK